jgi:tetratricopeptide (TPR) repeat protein
MTEWYRNTSWNEVIEKSFNEKLRRARQKGQYLRIQACTLAPTHPEVALRLLDLYFGLPIEFDHAQAHVDRATAFLALGRINDAITSYEAALAREAVFPNLQTQAYLDLSYLISTCAIREQYNRALHLLQTHEARLTFPIERFLWHAAYALIAADLQDRRAAKFHAEQALKASQAEHSGFRYDASLGLVTEHYDGVIKKLEALIGT